MHFKILSLLIILLSGVAAAQLPTITGVLSEVRVEGSPDNARLITTVIRSRAGTPVTQINLESERNLVLSLGVFAEVSVRLEPQPTGPVLVIRVRENPRIAEVSVTGSTLVSQARWRQFLNQLLITEGTPFNTIRANEALQAIQQEYRRAGFPFDVPVSLEVQPQEGVDDSDPPVTITYAITETSPIREIRFEGATILSEEELRDGFLLLRDDREFTISRYQDALRVINQEYFERGYRGSGVDQDRTTLVDGIMTVRIKELRIISLDTTAIGIDPAEFSVKVGELFNYDALLSDVRRLSRGRDRDIGLDFIPLTTGDVRVSFRSGPPGEAGAISEIVIEGNSVIGTETILQVLQLSMGDNFTSAVANDDFERIFRLYADRGYRIVTTAAFNYLDGTYIQRITELKIADYQVIFDRETPKSQPYIVSRYLPEPGTVLNENSLRQGIINGLRLSIYEITDVQYAPSLEPDAVIVQVFVRELPSGLFQPGLNYETSASANTFNAFLQYSDSNFLGEAHILKAELNAQTSDIGFLLGGNVSYSIPWLYYDFLDFKEVPTSVSLSLFSDVLTNQVMSAAGSLTICARPENRADNRCSEDERIRVGEYTKRETGAAFSIGRRILPFTNLSLSARGGYNEYKLEPGVSCEYDDTGKLKDKDCALERNEAQPFLPQSGFSSLVSTAIEYDDRDNINFPTTGINANARIGVGFGTDYRSPLTGSQQSYVYSPIEFGVRTYLQLERIFAELNDPNHVLAFRINGGHQLGGDYPANRLFAVGDSFINDTLIRGYNRGNINPSQTYAIGTVEYRYDFGFDTVATQTIIALVFADIGWASSVPNFENYQTPLFAGAGVGLQLNLGFGGFGLPAIRVDYSFSERNPSGVFRFRLGPVF